MNTDFASRPASRGHPPSRILIAGTLAAHAAETMALLSNVQSTRHRPPAHPPLPPACWLAPAGLAIETAPPSGAAPRSIHLVSLAEPAAAQSHAPATLAWISAKTPELALGILLQDLQGAWLDHHARVMFSRDGRIESYRLPGRPLADPIGYAVAIAAARLIEVPEMVVRAWLESRTPVYHPAVKPLPRAA